MYSRVLKLVVVLYFLGNARPSFLVAKEETKSQKIKKPVILYLRFHNLSTLTASYDLSSFLNDDLRKKTDENCSCYKREKN